MLEDKSIERLDFISDLQKQGVIVYYLMQNNLKITYYTKYIKSFFIYPSLIRINNEYLLLEKILMTIFSSEAFTFYKLKHYLKENLEKIFEQVNFSSLSSLINVLFSKYKDEEFCPILVSVVNRCIEGNFYSVEASDYESDVDINEIIHENIYQAVSYEYLNAAAQLDEEIQSLVQSEIESGLCDLPEEILMKLDDFSSYPFEINGSKRVIELYIDNSDYEPKLDNDMSYNKEIHLLFKSYPFE